LRHPLQCGWRHGNAFRRRHARASVLIEQKLRIVVLRRFLHANPYPDSLEKAFYFRIFRNLLDGWVETGIGDSLSRACRRGAFRDRHERWLRDAVDALALTDERRSRRTAKSCGPDIPTLISSWRGCLRIALTTVAKKPGSPRRSRRKP
jgi:hypothetical protein